jgi:N-acetyl-gamma-glutamylphosphate reductase
MKEKRKIKVGIIGGSGYAGEELILIFKKFGYFKNEYINSFFM